MTGPFSSLTWSLRPLGGPHADHPAIPATVPGSVQRDWANAHEWPAAEIDPQTERYEWMEDCGWLYEAVLPELEADADNTLRFRCEGIDYAFEIRLNDKLLLQQEGMFTPICLDLGKQIAAGSLLQVRIDPIPKLPGAQGRVQAAASCKPACSYGWDWHPRLVPSGIWRPCSLQVEPLNIFQELQPDATVSPDFTEGTVKVHGRLSLVDNGKISLKLRAPDGEVCVQTEAVPDSKGEFTAQLTLDKPQLWWPRGQGLPSLYELTISAPSGECIIRQLGFRRVRLIMNEGAWERPEHFPKSRSDAPATLEINGRAIFVKGSNWIPPRMFPGELNDTLLYELVQQAVDANFNLLRIWGGGTVNPPAFFEACDRMGIMVIQEFPLACNDYPDDRSYLRVLRQEADSILKRFRHHASLAIWSGGNELFNQWSGMTDQSLALRLLNARCLELDPERPFLPTMPVTGMAHGPYTYFDREHLREIPRIIGDAQNTAYTEFGQPGPASVSELKKCIPEKELFPPEPGGAWEHHHGLNAFYPESWLSRNILEHFHGKANSLEELVHQGQELQAFGYQMIYEGVRRQWPRASMAINWCFNEVWPCAANNSLLSWPNVPKPAYHAVAGCCRDVLLSVEIEKYAWNPRENFRTRIWLLNDSPEAVQSGDIQLVIECGDNTQVVAEHPPLQAPALRNAHGTEITFELPAEMKGKFWRLHARCTDEKLNQSYLLKTGAPKSEISFAPLITDPDLKLNQ